MGFTNHRPQQKAFEQHADKRHHNNGSEHAPKKRPLPQHGEGDGHVGTKHHHVALREVDHLCGLVDQHESQGDEPVDTPLRHAADD